MSAPRADCRRCAGKGWIRVSVLTRSHGVRSTECSCPECCGPSQSYLAGWKAAYDWQPELGVCRYCGEWTHLRDADGHPSHWTCAAKASRVQEAWTP